MTSHQADHNGDDLRAPTAPPVSALGPRRLGVVQVCAQSLAVGPILAVAVGGTIAVGVAGSSAPFIVVVAALGMASLAWVVGLYARRWAGVGVAYEFMALRFGPRAGVAAGGIFALLVWIGPGGQSLLAGILFQAFAVRHLGFDPGWWAGGAVFAAVVLVIAALGISVSARAQLALTGLSAIPIVIMVVAVLAAGGASGLTADVLIPGVAGEGDVWRGLLFVVAIYAGFELAASLGEEAREPRRTIPRAMLLTVLLCAGWYLLVIYAGVVGFGPADVATTWGTDPGGLSTLARRYVGDWDGTLVELAVLIDLAAIALAFYNSAARAIFGLARDGLLPGSLARTARAGVPVAGVAVTALSPVAILTVAAIGPEERLQTVMMLVLATGLLVLGMYLAFALGASALVRASPQGPWRWLVFAAAVAAPMLALYGTLVPLPKGYARTGVWIAVGLAVVAFTWAAALAAWRPDAVHAAGARAQRAG